MKPKSNDMKPNTIEIDEQGVFCYQTPDIASVPHLTDKAIKVAKYERVYFKDPIPVISAFVKTNGLLVEGSQYPIPNGYRIEITNDGNCVDLDCQVPEDHVHPYAILILKESEYQKQDIEASDKIFKFLDDIGTHNI